MNLPNQSPEYVAEVPSNIALIKYWGKQNAELQWPANDSLSMTLSHARSITRVQINNEPCDLLVIDGRQADQNSPQFKKPLQFLQKIRTILEEEIDTSRHLSITSHNTFPQSSGIASSASGIGALTLGAVAAWTGSPSFSVLSSRGFSQERLASLARLGSGSSCRSFGGGFVLWKAGKSPEDQETISLFSREHWDLQDMILIVSREPKLISSSHGHDRAWTSPLFKNRLSEVPHRLQRLQDSIVYRDFALFGAIIEEDALEMHEVMKTSVPSLNYLLPITREILQWILHKRASSHFPAYFTLDAGPNIHLICEKASLDRLVNEVKKENWPIEIIVDEIGSGPALSLSALKHQK